jgi:hypothetical protein
MPTLKDKVANPDVRTSAEPDVADPSKYDSDPYGFIDPQKKRDAYLVGKFGTEAMTIANVTEAEGYAVVTDWWARNGMLNGPEYALGLMMDHVNKAGIEAATKKLAPYVPIDMYTLSYAPTNGFWSDLFGTLGTKLGYESESVLGLRDQLEAIQTNGQPINWVVHSRGGVEFVQAAQGSNFDSLKYNSVVFNAGANTKWITNAVVSEKNIGEVIKDKLYNDSPFDLVPQIAGLHALTEPWKFFTSLIAAPCIFLCSPANSPHTLPYVQSEGK